MKSINAIIDGEPWWFLETVSRSEEHMPPHKQNTMITHEGITKKSNTKETITTKSNTQTTIQSFNPGHHKYLNSPIVVNRSYSI
jgi:hypothetical protein